MAKKKKSLDVNETAHAILQALTGEPDRIASVKTANGKSQEATLRVVRITKGTDPIGKNPAAVALGRLGGLKGGPARTAKLDPERRREIASKAARARWAEKAKG